MATTFLLKLCTHSRMHVWHRRAHQSEHFYSNRHDAEQHEGAHLFRWHLYTVPAICMDLDDFVISLVLGALLRALRHVAFTPSRLSSWDLVRSYYA
jgi:hypothetical protein